METVANNKLIAEFLGMETMTRTQNGWEVAKFNFHNSWDSLMLVVEKMANIKGFYKIENDLTDLKITAKIEDVYNSCISFIKYYNNQNK